MISAPSPAEAMCTTGSMPDVRLTGSGSLDNSLKASRSRMRAMTSNCLPSDLESDPEMVRISLHAEDKRETQMDRLKVAHGRNML